MMFTLIHIAYLPKLTVDFSSVRKYAAILLMEYAESKIK